MIKLATEQEKNFGLIIKRLLLIISGPVICLLLNIPIHMYFQHEQGYQSSLDVLLVLVGGFVLSSLLFFKYGEVIE